MSHEIFFWRINFGFILLREATERYQIATDNSNFKTPD
jgi:hypothetical protein